MTGGEWLINGYTLPKPKSLFDAKLPTETEIMDICLDLGWTQYSFYQSCFLLGFRFIAFLWVPVALFFASVSLKIFEDHEYVQDGDYLPPLVRNEFDDVRPDQMARGKLLHSDPRLIKMSYNKKMRKCLCFGSVELCYSWTTKTRQVTVSVELLAQLNVYSNTMPVVDAKTACDRLTYAARNICTVNLDRYDFMYENVVANTVFVGYALYKRTKQTTKSLPFYREPATQ